MKTFLIVFCSIFFATPFAAHAHGLSLYSQEKTLYASYGDRSPASGVEVLLVDENGVIILQEKTDEKGMWKMPEHVGSIPSIIIVEDAGGHHAKITWEEFLKGRPKGFFDLLSIRVIVGVVIIIGSGYAIQRFLLKKRT